VIKSLIIFLVPKLRLGMPSTTLRVAKRSFDTRKLRKGNEGKFINQTYTAYEFILGSGVQDLSCLSAAQDKSCIPSSFLRGHSPIKMAQMT
jgi:hypothetical protein